MMRHDFVKRLAMWTLFLAVLVLGGVHSLGEAQAAASLGHPTRQSEQRIPILGVMMGPGHPIGTVAHLTVSFAERTDATGLAVIFPRSVGRLSPMAQTSTEQAIYRAARVARLSTDSWTVMVSVEQPNRTIYGDSLSAMVGLTVIALAKGQVILPDRVMTGVISPDGHILTVGGIPLKLEAAEMAHLKRVIVPDEISVTDGDWQTPFLMHVSPVRSIEEAYLGLTGYPLMAQIAAGGPSNHTTP